MEAQIPDDFEGNGCGPQTGLAACALKPIPQSYRDGHCECCNFIPPCRLHDFMYSDAYKGPENRKEVDTIFYEYMVARNAGFTFWPRTYYHLVRWLGSGSWGRDPKLNN